MFRQISILRIHGIYLKCRKNKHSTTQFDRGPSRMKKEDVTAET